MLMPLDRRQLLDGIKHVPRPADQEPRILHLAPVDQHAVVGQDDEGLGLLLAQHLEELGRQIDGPHKRGEDCAFAAFAEDGGLDECAQEGVDGERAGCGFVFVVAEVGGAAEGEEVHYAVDVVDVVRGVVFGVVEFIEEGFEEGGAQALAVEFEDFVAAAEEVQPVDDVCLEVAGFLLCGGGEGEDDDDAGEGEEGVAVCFVDVAEGLLEGVDCDALVCRGAEVKFRFPLRMEIALMEGGHGEESAEEEVMFEAKFDGGFLP